MNWLIRRVERRSMDRYEDSTVKFQVGYYCPRLDNPELRYCWETLFEFDDIERASDKVNYLNGG